MDPQPAHPPTVPGPIALSTSAWPTVVGTISISLGSLGMLANMWAMVQPLLFNPALFGAQSDPQAAEMARAMRSLLPAQVGAGMLNLAASVLLLVSGVGVASRRRWGVRLTRLYAPLRMVTAAFATIVTAMAQQRVMAATPGGGGAMMAGIMLPITIIFGLAWGWAYPGFLLVWFTREKVRDETARWR